VREKMRITIELSPTNDFCVGDTVWIEGHEGTIITLDKENNLSETNNMVNEFMEILHKFKSNKRQL
jgi:hypothetical protein